MKANHKLTLIILLFLVPPLCVSCDKSIYNDLFEKGNFISYITPDSGKEGLLVTITDLHGDLFMAGAAVKLARAGYAAVNATAVTVVSPQQITCQFDLTGVAPGQWFVVVTNPDGDIAILPDGFTVSLHTVTYIGNGFTAGNPPPGSPFGYYAGATVTVSGNTGDFRGQPVPGGFPITQRMTEWNTLPGGGGTAYDPGDTFAMPAADVVLYAQWTSDASFLGKIGQAGGFVFYDNGSYISSLPAGSPLWRFMEAAPVNLGLAPSGEEDESSGATGTAIGDGLQNTILKTGVNPDPGTCASLCYNYVLNGYSDWFMPSYDELQAMYDNLYAPDPAADIAGFDSNSYWSSTETYWLGPPPPPIWDVYYFQFSDAWWYVGGQSSLMYARPARRF